MALKSKFVKRRDVFQAQKVFTDRMEPGEVFRKSIDCIQE